MVIRCNINHDFKSTFLGSINLNLDDYQGRYWNKDTSRKMKKFFFARSGREDQSLAFPRTTKLSTRHENSQIYVR